MRRARGFTLVELLVAISILALVAVLGWRGLDGIVRSRTALTAQMNTARGLQLAFAQMQSDCEHLASAGLLHQRPNLQADTDSLTLVRTVMTENEPTRLQVVAYRVRDGVLERRESIYTRDLLVLDALWKAAVSDSDTTQPVSLQQGVTGMRIRDWEGDAWQTMTAPKSAAAPGALGAPLIAPRSPTGLEVSLQVQDLPLAMVKIFLLGGV